MTASFPSSSPNPEPDSSAMPARVTSLPLGTKLREFELTGVLGEGGFSFVYTAWDHSLERTVAIKEYMPGAIAARLPGGLVLPKSPKHEEAFQAGLASFVNEARLLARFTHPALVQVYCVWEQNGTAYMAMQYCVGKTLRQISSDPAIVKDEQWLKALFAPILDALELLHAHNCFHRDISPDNILVLQGGGPVLLDFGAARQIVGDMSQSLTVILKPGFAPIEQYADDSSLQQGPWTDVYGVGAILYYMLMGKPPVASVARLVKDPMAKLADSDELASVSRPFRQAIDRALAVQPGERIPSIAQLRDALQLPTYNQDVQIGDALGVSAEMPSPYPDAATSLERTDTGAGALFASSAYAAAPAPSDQTTNGAAAITFRRPSSRLPGAVALVVGLIIVAALVTAFNFLNKPPPPVNQGTRVVANKVVPADAMSKTPPAVDSSTPPPVDTPASAATALPMMADDRQASAPQANASAPSAAVAAAALREAQTQFSTSSADTPPPPIISNETEQPFPPPPPEKAVTALKKTPPAANAANNALASSPRTLPSSVTAFNANSSSPAATPSPAKTKRQIASGTPESTAAAFQPAALPDKTSAVRLSIKPWGQVTVDGRPRGISPPLTRLSLTPGNHVVVITNGNFPSATIPITVSEKEDIVVSHRFGIKP